MSSERLEIKAAAVPLTEVALLNFAPNRLRTAA